MDEKHYGETKDHRDGLREVPGASNADEQDPLEEVEGEVEDEEQDEQPELGSGPATS